MARIVTRSTPPGTSAAADPAAQGLGDCAARLPPEPPHSRSPRRERPRSPPCQFLLAGYTIVILRFDSEHYPHYATASIVAKLAHLPSVRVKTVARFLALCQCSYSELLGEWPVRITPVTCTMWTNPYLPIGSDPAHGRLILHAHHHPIPVATRVHNFTYAIRNIVAEARAVEATGTKVATSTSATRFRSGSRRRRIWSRRSAGHERGANDYVPSPGIAPAREAVATEWSERGFPVDAGPRTHHRGHVRRHRAGADGTGQPRRRRAGADADLPALHGGAGEDRRRARRTTAPIPRAAGCPTSTTWRA